MFSEKDFKDSGLGTAEPTQPVIKVRTTVDLDPVRTFDRAAKAYRDSNPGTGLEDVSGDSVKPMRKTVTPEPKFRLGQRVRHTNGTEGTVVECSPGEAGSAVIESSGGVRSRYPCASLVGTDVAPSDGSASKHVAGDQNLVAKLKEAMLLDLVKGKKPSWLNSSKPIAAGELITMYGLG